MSIVHSRNANRILHGCMINGGTYIKIGQGLVSLSHILPREYITTLQWLQDKCLVRKGDEVEQIFMAEFGKSPDDMFKSFQHEPIAAASLAQVNSKFVNLSFWSFECHETMINKFRYL